jgi:hypothetical protein
MIGVEMSESRISPSSPDSTSKATRLRKRPKVPAKRWRSTSRGCARMVVRLRWDRSAYSAAAGVSERLPVLSGQQLIDALGKIDGLLFATAVAMCGSNTTSARLRWWSRFIVNSSGARSLGSCATLGSAATSSGNSSDRRTPGLAPGRILPSRRHSSRVQTKAASARTTPFKIESRTARRCWIQSRGRGLHRSSWVADSSAYSCQRH